MREWSIIVIHNPSNPHSHPFPTFSTSKPMVKQISRLALCGFSASLLKATTRPARGSTAAAEGVVGPCASKTNSPPWKSWTCVEAWGFHVVTPKWMIYFMENPSKTGCFGGTPILEHMRKCGEYRWRYVKVMRMLELQNGSNWMDMRNGWK